MANPADLLAKLAPGAELAAGKVRGLGPALPGLIAAGWVEARKDGRAVLVTLTAAGVAERDRLAAQAPPPKPPKPARVAKAKAPTATVRLAELEAMVAALAARVAALEGRRAPAPDPAALRSTIVAAIGELDATGRLGGLVPIPDLRAELRRRGVGASDAEVTTALEDLERAWTIDLAVAQSPTSVTDRGAGIERSGRGLLYYVARR